MSNVSFWIEKTANSWTEVVGKVPFAGGGGVRFTRGHFGRQANLAGKIALKLLGAEGAGKLAFGFHGAIEAAVHFVKKGLTGSQLPETGARAHRHAARQRRRQPAREYGRDLAQRAEIAVCLRGEILLRP